MSTVYLVETNFIIPVASMARWINEFEYLHSYHDSSYPQLTVLKKNEHRLTK